MTEICHAFESPPGTLLCGSRGDCHIRGRGDESAGLKSTRSGFSHHSFTVCHSCPPPRAADYNTLLQSSLLAQWPQIPFPEALILQSQSSRTVPSSILSLREFRHPVLRPIPTVPANTLIRHRQILLTLNLRYPDLN